MAGIKAMTPERKLIFYLFMGYALAGVVTMLVFDGTGDDGDSIMHYLFARYAPTHPVLFFNHWAKPVFVILAAPFAQFGFNGIKFFNLLVTLFAIFLTYRTAETIGIRNAPVAIILMIFMPLYYVLTFSGLTEPLFALFLISSVFLALSGKGMPAALVVSFIPFVRSEGLIILALFAVWFLSRKEWKNLALLATGHVVFSLAGSFFYNDILWVFTRNPYITDATYGSGNLLHFVQQLNYVIGIPVYILLVAGLIRYILAAFLKKFPVRSAEVLLIPVMFLAYFLAHTLFWYFGWFHSMGLKRVLLGVAPLMALIALRGINFLAEELPEGKRIPRLAIGGILLAWVVAFPFTHNPAAVQWDREMRLSGSQTLAKGVAGYLHTVPVSPQATFFFNAPYLSVVLNIDPFDKSRVRELSRTSLEGLNPGDLVIWDSWFSVTEATISLDELSRVPDLVREIDFSSPEKGSPNRFVVFRRI